MSHRQPPPATHLAFTEAAAQQINQSQLEHDSLGLETYMLNLVLYEAADIKPAAGTNQLLSEMNGTPTGERCAPFLWL